MAYVFDQLNQALQPSTTNIFGTAPNQAATQDQGQDQSAPQRAGGNAPVGGSASAAGGQVGAIKDTKSGLQSEAPDSSAIVGKQAFGQTPGFVGDLLSKQGTVKTALQNEANTYLQGQSNRDVTGGITSADLAAAGTDKDAAGRIGSRLTSTAGPQADQFATQTDITNPALTAIQSPQALKDYLQGQGGAGYTAGMSGLDQMLLQNDTGFQQARGQALKNQQDIQNLQSGLNANTQGQAQTALNTAYGNYGDTIRANLGSQAQGLLSPAQTQADQENAARAALRSKQDSSYLSDQAGGGLEELSKDAANKSLIPYLQQAQVKGLVDPSQFATVGGDVSAGNFLNPAQAAQYSQLEQLLGKGGLNSLGAAGARDSFNAQAYETALKNAALGLQPPPPPPVPAPTVTSTTPSANPLNPNSPLNPTNPANPLYPVTPKLPTLATPVPVPPVLKPVAQAVGQGAKTVAAQAAKPAPIVAPRIVTPPPPPTIQQIVQSANPVNAVKNIAASLPQVKAPAPVAHAAASVKKFFSDKNAKTDIQPASPNDVSGMLQHLKPATYNYKAGLGMPPGPQMGVMAQDLQKSPLGAQAVSPGPGGLKQVDYSKLMPSLTAALASHDERIRAIEAKKKRG